MVSTAAAAQLLRISEVQVRNYIDTGLLAADLTLGGAWDIDTMNLRALSRARGRGRRWSETTAWAALDLLGSGTTARLDGTRLSRLRAALRVLDAPRLAYLAEGRGTPHRLQRLNGTHSQFLDRTLQSGMSALDVARRRTFGLTKAASDLTICYVDRDAARALGREFGLQPRADGDVLLRLSHRPVVNDAVVALDLYSYGDTRESAAGREWLEGTLHGL